MDRTFGKLGQRKGSAGRTSVCQRNQRQCGGGDGLEGEYLANRRKFVIDFSGFGTLDAAKEIAAGNIWADISNRAGTISNVRLMYTPSINGASLYFDIEPNTDITELRLLLRNKAENNKVISEVWSYQLRQ